VEKWQMTFNQYCEDYLKNCRYRAAYEADRKKWENKKRDLLNGWVEELKTRALVGPLSSPVIVSFIRQFDEALLYRTFRGIYEKGIENFRIPQKLREIRRA
jgi:hypothetical protein